MLTPQLYVGHTTSGQESNSHSRTWQAYVLLITKIGNDDEELDSIMSLSF